MTLFLLAVAVSECANGSELTKTVNHWNESEHFGDHEVEIQYAKLIEQARGHAGYMLFEFYDVRDAMAFKLQFSDWIVE